MDRTVAAARESVRRAIKARYFPEIWYILENWFSLAKGRKALEVGFGIGRVAEALAKSGWDVVAVDPSEKALAQLKGRFERRSLKGGFELAEPDNLPFAKEVFDAVAAVNSLEYSYNPFETMREIARVLVPGGRAVVATFNRVSPWGLPAVLRSIRPDRDENRAARFLTRDEFLKAIKTSGLELEELKDRAAYLPVAAASVKLRLPVAGSFVALLRKPSRSKAAKKDEAPKASRPPTATKPKGDGGAKSDKGKTGGTNARSQPSRAGRTGTKAPKR